jgi:hypothetical protein
MELEDEWTLRIIVMSKPKLRFRVTVYPDHVVFEVRKVTLMPDQSGFLDEMADGCVPVRIDFKTRDEGRTWAKTLINAAKKNGFPRSEIVYVNC